MDSRWEYEAKDPCIHSFQGVQPQLYGGFFKRMASLVAGRSEEQTNRPIGLKINGGVQYTWLVSQV